MTLTSSFTALCLMGTFLSQQVMAVDCKVMANQSQETANRSRLMASQPDVFERFGAWHLPEVENTVPIGNLILDCSTTVSYGVCRRVSDHLKLAKDISVDALWHRDVSTLTGIVFDSCMKAASNKIVSEIFKKKSDSYNGIDVDTLMPTVKKLRDVIEGQILMMVSKTDYFIIINGVRVPVHKGGTVFQMFLAATIPDVILGKDLLIRLVGNSLIRNYLDYKYNELITKSLLSLYKRATDRPLEVTANDLSDLTKKIQEKSQSAVPPPNTSKTATSDFNAAIKEQEDPVKAQEEDDLREFYLIECEAIKEDNSDVWNFLAPRLQHYVRLSLSTLLEDYTLAVIQDTGKYALSSMLPQTNILTLYGGAGAGGYYFGGPLGGGAGMTALYLLNLTLEEFAIYLRKYAETNLKLLVSFYSYSLIPYSSDEHHLYHLNSAPSELETAIYASDYAAKHRLSQQYLVRAILKDVYKKSFLSRLLSFNDKKEIAEVIQSTQPTKKNNYVQQIKVGQMLLKKKRGEELTEEEKKFLAHLIQYPSYAMKKKEIDLIDLWGRGARSELKKQSAHLKEDSQRAETELQEIFELFGKQIPREIALAYQQLAGDYFWDDRYSLEFIEVEAIMAANIVDAVEGLSKSEIDLLKESMSDYQFIAMYIKQFIDRKTVRREQEDFTSQEVQDLMTDPGFIALLPGQYAGHKYQKYISRHYTQLKSIEHSVYGFGLSLVDTIELHQRLTQEQLKDLLEDLDVNFLIATDSSEVALKNAASAFFTNPDSPRDDLSDASKIIYGELKVINEIVEKLVEVNKNGIVTHYFQEFMKRFDLDQFMQDIAREIPKFDESGKEKEEEKDYAYSCDEATLKMIFGETKVDADLYNWAYLQAKWITKDKFMKLPLRDSFRDALSEHGLDEELRSLVYQRVSNKILEYLILHQAAPEVQGFSILFKGVPSAEGVAAGDAKEDNWSSLAPFINITTSDKRDWASYQVAEIIARFQHELNFKEKGEAEWKGFPGVPPATVVAIYKKIQEEKREACNEDVRRFDATYPLALMMYKITLQEYEDKLFYSLQEIYDRLQVAEITPKLEAIYNQPKREIS